ncbi:YLP motif-containing protein 1, partial [Elysia marginata]
IGGQSRDGPRPPDGPAPEKPAPPTRPPSPDPVLLAELEKLKKEEEVFLEQYKQWKKQYDDWRDQNQNHPNKDQYEQYLNQWKTYEGQMESRRISIANQKASLEEKVSGGKTEPGEPEKMRAMQNFKKSHDFRASPFSHDGQGDWNPSKKIGQFNVDQNQEEQQRDHHPIEGDDIGEEDMNLDDEEETAGGGIIESSSHPPPHESWSNRLSETLEAPSQEYGEKWKDEHANKFWHSKEDGGPPPEEESFPGRPHSNESGFPSGLSGEKPRFSGGPVNEGPRFPGGPHGEGPRFPGAPHHQGPSEGARFPGGPHSEGARFSGRPPSGEPRFPRRPPSGESRFSSATQEWEQPGSGPGGFHRGRGHGERGMAGQGPRFGWRGGGGPRFQAPTAQRRGFPDGDSEWSNYEETHPGFQDGNDEGKTEEGGFTDQEPWYEGTENESQQYGDTNLGAGRGFLPNRGRGAPGVFQRGRGGEVYSNRGRGFDRGRGDAFKRGGYGAFSRGGAFMGRNVQYEEETNETDYFNTSVGSAIRRGRGGWPVRGGGGSQGPLSCDNAQNEGAEGEENLDDIEHQAELQYEGDQKLEDQERDSFQVDFQHRGRGGMYRGRGRGGFDSSFGREESSENDGRHYNSEDYHENPQGAFNDSGRGSFQSHGFMGRGRGEMSTAMESTIRGFHRGRGTFRGRGGYIANFQNRRREYDDGYGYGEGDEEFPEQDKPYPEQPSSLDLHGRGQGTMQRPGFGQGSFAPGENEFVSDGFPWDKDNERPARGRGLGIRPGRGRGTDWSRNSENAWNDGDYADEAGVSTEGPMYENRETGDNSVAKQKGQEEDEPLPKRGRFDADDRDPYDRLPPPFEFGDRYRDPYSRYPDPYLRDPYFDPYAVSPYERLPEYDRYGRYDRGLPEKKSFVPAESIDYGHGEADKEKKRAALQQKEVIDYGHGRVSEPKDDSAVEDRQQKFESRLPEDNRDLGGNMARGWDMDERVRDQQLDHQKDFRRDNSDNPYRVSQGRDIETYDYSNRSGQERNKRIEYEDMYASSPSNRRHLDSARRSGEDLPRGGGLDFEDFKGDRRVHPDDPYERNRTGLYSRELDDQTKRDLDVNDRNVEDRYGRDRDNRYSRNRDNRYSRDRDDRFDRDSDKERDTRYSKDRGALFDHDGDVSYSRERQKEDPYKERDRLYSRETRREESPRRRISDLDDRHGSRRDSPYRKEDFPQGRDYLRREDNAGNSQTYGRGESPYKRRPEKDDPYSSLGHESLRNRDAQSGMSRWADKDRYGMGSSPRDQRYGAVSGARDMYGEGSLSSPSRNSPVVRGPAPPAPLPVAEVKKVEDLLCSPGRQSRPPQLVVIIRGLPGSGKTYVSKLLREKEIKFGGAAPRMLCLDDYFMVEVEKQEVDPDTGKKVKKKVLEYEYEQPVEEAYRQSLLKSFKKTVDDGFFPFIIVDATNEKVVHFSEFWSYAKSRGFQVYVGELNVDVATCIQRNIHNWTEWDIEKVKSNWEPLPNHYIRLDLRWLLQDDSIDEVEMEDTDPNETKVEKEEEEEEEDAEEEEGESGFESIYKKSKWELDSSEKTLDKLDGIPISKKHIAEHQSLKDYLQLDQPDQMDEDYFSRESLPGKKRVRWADLEEKKTQNRRRDLGFIVGQTQRDWERITDDDFATKALNQTKYFYKN